MRSVQRFENGYPTISASKGLDKDEKDKGRQVQYPSGALRRSDEQKLYVGEDVKQEDVAKYENGIFETEHSEDTGKRKVERKRP